MAAMLRTVRSWLVGAEPEAPPRAPAAPQEPVFRPEPPKFVPVPGAADTSAEGAQRATAAQLRAAIEGCGSDEYAVKELPDGNWLVFQVENPKVMDVEHGGVFGYNKHAVEIREIALTIFLVDAIGEVNTECKPIGPFQLWCGFNAGIAQWAREICAQLSDKSRPVLDAWNTANWPEDNLFDNDTEERAPGTHTAWKHGAWPEYDSSSSTLPHHFWIAPPKPRWPPSRQ